MKVSELTGPLLDYWVAKAEGRGFVMHRGHPAQELEFDPEIHANDYSLKEWKAWIYFQPSSDWAQGGPIVEANKIELIYYGGCGHEGPWEAQLGESIHYIDQGPGAATAGATPLEAAMRAYVKDKLGEEIEDIALS